MEEEVNDELEEKLYAMIHYVDETQVNVSTESREDAPSAEEPRGTVRRYWRTEINNPYQKVNTNKETTQSFNNKNTVISTSDTNKPKEEKSVAPATPTPDLSIFDTINPKHANKTIQILENDDPDNVFELQTSDEDEVIEVKLPPKPTITIESSDDETPCPPPQISPAKIETKSKSNKSSGDRDVSASPVPSVVSSVSDDFIRSDCIALNISSRHPDDHSFDFGLHGSDLLGSTPAKKKKKKKSKDHLTSTPLTMEPDKNSNSNVDPCFATPKSKAKNKKQKNKSNPIHEKSVLVDIYDSDSNQSLLDRNQNHNSYIVTEKSFPSADVYESDSSQSEMITKPTPKNQPQSNITTNKNSSNVSLEKPHPETPKSRPETPKSRPETPKSRPETPKSSKKHDTNKSLEKSTQIVDLTNEDVIHVRETITENIVMGNVTGFTESDDYGDDSIINTSNNAPVLGSTKVPAILYDDLDFDNLKGKDQVCRSKRYDGNTIRAEMEKFYNESWGGENFNHREIQKYMSRDKSLWAIDPKDRMPGTPKRRVLTCNYCNRVGHRDDSCRAKPAVCHVCGGPGHREPRCPRKICVNCGAPNHMYSTMCRACAAWGRLRCAECGQHGHPRAHCPDLWRRYHHTTELDSSLEECQTTKKYYQQYCSGCARKGHLVHACRISLPFSGLPIYSPYVSRYTPIYPPDDTQKKQKCDEESNTPNRNKRQSKSPSFELQNNKRRNISTSETEEKKRPTTPQRKNSQSKDPTPDASKDTSKNVEAKSQEADSETAPDYIPMSTTNHDKNGCIIQDNQVSDTSEVVTSARVYVTTDIIEKLKTKEGGEWLKKVSEQLNINVEFTDINSFLSIKGNIPNQEAFQFELRDWIKDGKEIEKTNNGSKSPKNPQEESDPMSNNIPKNRNNVLRKLTKALESLKQDLGDPKTLYHKLNWLQNHHQTLLKQKVISPKRVSNNRDNINEIMTKLNTVLLGQAGLAGGYRHVEQLYNLHEKLMSFRQKNIPSNLRKEIGEHFYYIFAAVPRNDYDELMRKYYVSKTMSKKKKQLENRTKFSPKINKPTENVYVQPQTVDEVVPTNNQTGNTHPGQKKPDPNILKNKLQFYHKRLLWAKPIDTVLKKTRSELVRKLHSHIGSLTQNVKMTSKIMKKIKKTQEQVRLFLTNV